MTKVFNVGILFSISLFTLSPLNLYADDAFSATSSLDSVSWIDEINWHGFVSQNFVLTDENNFLGSSSDGSFKSNEAALNASWRANESLQFSLQGLYKQIGNNQPKGGRVDYAIMDWRILDNFEQSAGVRLGRLKNPYGFFNETRDVAATNISILLPESIYVDYLSQLFHSSDSVGAYGLQDIDSGVLSVSAVFGRPILNDQITSSLVGIARADGEISNERGGFLSIGYEDGGGLWRTALSYVRFHGEFSPGENDQLSGLSEGDLTIEQLLLSLEFNWHDVQLITEIQRRNTQLEDIYPFDIYEKSLAYYVQAVYSPSPLWKIYLRRDEIFRFKDDRHGKAYVKGLKMLNPASEVQAHAAFAKDTTLGFRYTPNFEWSFAMEVHNIDGTYWLPDIENPDIGNQRRYWNMFLAQVAYRF